MVLTEEQVMLRDNTRGFLSKNAPIAHLRHLRDSCDRVGFSRELWKEFVNMGLAGILIPQAHGGLGLGHVEAGVVMEELGHTLTPSPFLSTAVLAATAIARFGSEAQRRNYLPRIIAGEAIGALAVDESPKHRPENVTLAAARTGGGFTLAGAKTFVVDGHVADFFVVAARTGGAPAGEDGIALFLVDAGAKGIRADRTSMVDSHNAARVVFENVRVGAEAMLGDERDGRRALEGTLNTGRAAVAAEMVGAADEAFARTMNYLRERKQFGRFIGEFQALQHRAAHLFCELEVTRSAVMKALATLDESFDQAGLVVSAAKARAGRSAALAVQEGVQMHGGIGMTDEFDIGLFMKRVRVCDELFGDANFHADRLARLGGY
jgi:alkylation response protein AidB-like acyl-CoA dehydrogenase